MEEKTYQIIKTSTIKKDFNVADLSYYDTTYMVIKYFFQRDGYQINYDDYYQNQYLFIINHNNDYEKTYPMKWLYLNQKDWLKNDL